jgi:hypothetical protein
MGLEGTVVSMVCRRVCRKVWLIWNGNMVCFSGKAISCLYTIFPCHRCYRTCPCLRYSQNSKVPSTNSDLLLPFPYFPYICSHHHSYKIGVKTIFCYTHHCIWTGTSHIDETSTWTRGNAMTLNQKICLLCI